MSIQRGALSRNGHGAAMTDDLKRAAWGSNPTIPTRWSRLLDRPTQIAFRIPSTIIVTASKQSHQKSHYSMAYRSEIDGLRAIAVLSVMFFHARFGWFSGGFVGVDIFFVISGYLITSIIISEQQAKCFSLISFYERRARRILPALFLVLFACLPFAWLWMEPSDLKRFSVSLSAVSLFASNFVFWKESGYFAAAAELKPLLHTWSLAIEEQYYVLFPALIMVFWPLGLRWMISLFAIVATASLFAAE